MIEQEVMVRTIKKELILQYNIKEDMNGCFKNLRVHDLTHHTNRMKKLWFWFLYKRTETFHFKDFFVFSLVNGRLLFVTCKVE